MDHKGRITLQTGEAQIMSSAKILRLDDYRPRVTERMQCLFCGLTHVLRHDVKTRQPYFECPGCDETASVPEWSLRYR